MDGPVSSEKPGFISRRVTESRYFFLNLDPLTGDSLKVACGGREKALPGYRITRRRFPFYAIECVVGGRGRLILGQQSYDISPGSVFTYGPGITHEIRPLSSHTLTKYFIDFCGSEAESLLMSHSLGPGRHLRVYNLEAVVKVCEMMLEDGGMHSAASPAICAKLLELLMLKISEETVVTESPRSASYSTYLKCCAIMDEDPFAFDSLEDLASACCLTRSYLCRLFKTIGSDSPYHRLLKLKMERAAQLLLKSDMLVKQVAVETGYTDPYQFSRSFKRVFGISPDKFRDIRRE